MPRMRQRGRPDSAHPMGIPDSYTESDSDNHPSEAAHTPPSSDEHPSPPHNKPAKINDAHPRTPEQITEEANLCLASQQAFDRDDIALDQLNERLVELGIEYRQIVEGAQHHDWNYGPADASSDGEEYDQGHYGYHDTVPSSRTFSGRAMKQNVDLVPSTARALRSTIDGFPAANNIGSTVEKFNTVAGGMINRALEPHTRYQRKVETQSPSRANTTPRSTEVKIAPFAGKVSDQSTDQNGRKKWSTVKVKSGDNKTKIATSDGPNLHSADHDTSVRRTTPLTRLFQARADIRSDRRVSPRLDAFDDVHRQICEQDRLTLEKAYSQLQECSNIHSDPLSSDSEAQQSETVRSNQQSEHSKCSNGWKNCGTCAVCTSEDVTTASPASKGSDRMSLLSLEAYHATLEDKVYNVRSSLIKDGITIADLPLSSDTPIIKVYIDSPLLKDGVVVADLPTLDPHQYITAGAKDKKQAAAPVDDVIHVPHAVCEDPNDSDPGPVSKIRKVVHRTKSSDVMTATGFASSDNTTAPDDVMVGEFLEIADYKFSRDEAFEILRMCGANLIAAISMYRNARNPDHLRQMLRAWLAPLENDEFEAAARFYSQEFRRRQDNTWGASSKKYNGIDSDGPQPIAATMTVRDAFALLGLEIYESVDMTTLRYSLRSRLSSYAVSPQTEDQLHKAYGAIFQHQINEDCWELCLSTTYCGYCDMPDCEAERFACDHDVHEHQPAWSVISDPINTRETKVPVPTAYTVTYWATIESGDKTVHIPIDSSNVTGPEKNIIEGSTGMKKVWKWAREKGLSDKISLQDAFDLAKNMHGEDKDDESVGSKPQATKDTPRAFSRSPRQEWTFPAPEWAAPGAMFRCDERSEISSAGPSWGVES